MIQNNRLSLFGFSYWLESQEPEQHPYNNFERQKFFPFVQQANDERVDPKKVLKYKSPDTFAKANQKGGRRTEMAAERLVSQRIGSPYLPWGEKVVRTIPNAVVIPGYELPPSEKYPKGISRPESYVAFVVTQGDNGMPGPQPKRILAYYQGIKKTFDPSLLEYDPIGGLIVVGGHITTVWVHPEHRSNPNNLGPWSNYKLYRSLREFAASLGHFDLEPGDDLTSKSYRASDARYQYRRATELKGGNI